MNSNLKGSKHHFGAAQRRTRPLADRAASFTAEWEMANYFALRFRSRHVLPSTGPRIEISCALPSLPYATLHASTIAKREKERDRGWKVGENSQVPSGLRGLRVSRPRFPQSFRQCTVSRGHSKSQHVRLFSIEMLTRDILRASPRAGSKRREGQSAAVHMPPKIVEVELLRH